MRNVDMIMATVLDEAMPTMLEEPTGRTTVRRILKRHAALLLAVPVLVDVLIGHGVDSAMQRIGRAADDTRQRDTAGTWAGGKTRRMN